MKYQIIILLLSLAISSYSQKPCLDYDKAMDAGKKAAKAENYQTAINKFLVAQVAARECNLATKKPSEELNKIFQKLEQQKRDAEKARNEAIDAKKAVDKEQEKANRLKKLVNSIDEETEEEYDYLYNNGIRLFEEGNYKDALVFFANAQFFDDNDEVRRMIRYVSLGIEANENFYNDIRFAKEQYQKLITNYSEDTSYCGKQIKEIDRTYKIFNQALNSNDFTTINKLNLANNMLKTLPKEVGLLINLQELNLGFNHELNYSKAFRMLSPLDSLKKLHLNSSQLKELSKEIQFLINLEELNLSSNLDLNYSKTFRLLSSLDSLKKLILNGTKHHHSSFYKGLSELPKEIGLLVNLQELNLEFNKLKAIPEEIRLLVNLQCLNLSSNQLKEIPNGIGLLSNLKELNLSNNIDLNLSKTFLSLSNSNSLEKLSLSIHDNQIMPNEIRLLSNLKELSLIINVSILRTKYLNLGINYGEGFISSRDQSKIKMMLEQEIRLFLKKALPNCDIAISFVF